MEEKDRPNPKLETMIEVQVNFTARIFNKVKVQDHPAVAARRIRHRFCQRAGGERPGASNGAHFIGERAARASGPDLSAHGHGSGSIPMLTKLTGTLESLQEDLRQSGQDLPPKARTCPKRSPSSSSSASILNELSAYDGPLRQSLQNIETLTSDQGKLGQSLNHLAELTGPDGSLSKTFKNTEKFTSQLTANDDAAEIMRNFRSASENLNRELTQIGQQFSVIGGNLEEASDTVKHQPWRLIWPTTKKYPAAAIDARRHREPRSPPRHRRKRALGVRLERFRFIKTP